MHQMRKNIPPITNKSTHEALCNALLIEPSLPIFTQLTDNQYSHNSLLAIRTDWIRFINFCQLKQVSALPTSVTTLRIFLESEAKTRKFASVRRYSVNIGLINTILSFPNPSSNAKVKHCLAQLRLQKHGDAKQANALTREHLFSLHDMLSSSDIIQDIRNLAIYFIMFECALKRSELKQLQFNDIDIEKQTLHIAEHNYQLSETATKNIARWFSVSDIKDSYTFRSIDRHGNISEQSLDDSSIYRIIRKASDLLQLSSQYSFSGQSTRVGAVKELAQQGMNVKEIQHFGRWISPAMPSQYIGNTNTAEQEKMKFLNYESANEFRTQSAKNSENE